MTRKDYVAVAAAIREEADTADANNDASAVLALARLARTLARVFKADNSNFRFDTFYNACGFDDWGEPTRSLFAEETVRG